MTKEVVKALYKTMFKILKTNKDFDTLKTLQTCTRKNMNLENPQLIEYHIQNMFERMLTYNKYNRFNTINKYKNYNENKN